MAIEILTKEDLQIFRIELINELKQLFLQHTGRYTKDWLKSNEVRKLLGISPNTLQNLRVTGKLYSSKVGGIHYYRFSEIEKLLDNSDQSN